MNCEKCQELVGDLLDGAISREDESVLSRHLEECLECAGVRNDLESILSFCREHRGEYVAPPNENALWLRIRNTIEAEIPAPAPVKASGTSWSRWLHRSWELSVPQLAASAAAIILVVSLGTAIGMRRWDNAASNSPQALTGFREQVTNVRDRFLQQEQAINYWNQRVELNKARWNQDMRDTFDRNLKVIDQAVNDSLKELNQNPHDEISEEMLNAALNEKLALLKEFSDL